MVGFKQGGLLREPKRLIVTGCPPLAEGDWLTIDGMTGEVFGGRARVEKKHWTSHPELVQLSLIVERAVASGRVPPTCAGAVWQMWDFFRHGVPLCGADARTRVARSRRQGSSIPPLKNSGAIRRGLVQVAGEAQENYDAVIRGLIATVEKELRSAIGPQRAALCCRVLWEPAVHVRPSDSRQLVGFEFFDINRYVHNLIGISHIRFLVECEVPSPGEAWFIERAGRVGFRVIPGAGTITACRIEVNGARLAHEDIPNFYTWLRRRKHFWNWFRENDTSHDEISAFLRRYPRTGAADKKLAPLCAELGLIRGRSLTIAGLSLIGRRKEIRVRIP